MAIPVKKNQLNEDFFKRIMQKGTLGHAYLLEGPAGSGKKKFSVWLAQAIFCINKDENQNPCLECYQCQQINDRQHPDIIEIKVDGAAIKVDQIRDLIMRLSKTSMEDDGQLVIIDEADKMLNKGFIEDMEFILNKISKDSAIGLFSATIDKEIKYICDKYMNSSNILEVQYKEELNKKQINENLFISSENDKYENLKNIIYKENPKSLIIFCNTKDKVTKLYSNMKNDGFLVKELHGDMSQDKRIFVIKDFKNEKFNILISTDVAARGIHIDDISLVINYDVPRDKENYIHRIGRTGRKDKYGKAITIVTNKDEKYINEIEEYIGYKINKLYEIKLEEVVECKVNFEKSSKNILTVK